MRYRYNPDSNQGEIVAALKAHGASVVVLSVVGRGVPDLLVGYNQKNYLLEVKTAAGKLLPTQEAFFRVWSGQATVVTTPAEAVQAISVPT